MTTILLLAVSILLAAACAVVSFGWLGAKVDTAVAVGFLGLAVIAFLVAELLTARVGRRS